MNKTREKFLLFESSVGKEFIDFSLLGLIIANMLIFLNRLPSMLTSFELSTINGQSSLSYGPLHLPTAIQDWPYWLVQLNSLAINENLVRFVPALFSIIGIVLFYVFLKLLFKKRDALWGAALLATNIGFLLASLNPAHSVGYALAVISLGLIGLTLLRRDNKKGLYLVLPSIPLAWYAGIVGILFSIITVVALHKILKEFSFTLSRKNKLLALFALLVFALPLLSMAANRFTQTWPWQNFSLETAISNIEAVATGLVGGTVNDFGVPISWSLLSITEIGLLILAVLLFRRKISARRYRVLWSLFLISVVPAVLFGYSLEFIAAFMFIATTLCLCAVRYLRDSWHIILPRNKTGKTVATLVVQLVLGGVLLLNVARAHWYWPHIKNVQENYSQPYSAIGI